MSQEKENSIIPFPLDNAWEEPDLEALTTQELHAYLGELRQRLEDLNRREPGNERSDAYETWAEAHEDLEDAIDEVLDLLE